MTCGASGSRVSYRFRWRMSSRYARRLSRASGFGSSHQSRALFTRLNAAEFTRENPFSIESMKLMPGLLPSRCAPRGRRRLLRAHGQNEDRALERERGRDRRRLEVRLVVLRELQPEPIAAPEAPAVPLEGEHRGSPGPGQAPRAAVDQDLASVGEHLVEARVELEAAAGGRVGDAHARAADHHSAPSQRSEVVDG